MTIPLNEEQYIQIKHPQEVYQILRLILEQDEAIDRDKEHFWVMGLMQNKVIHYVELVSLGSLTTTIVHPREVFRLSIQKGTANIILIHNHPSGNLSASLEDLDVTKRLVQVGHIVNVPVLDHIIISLSGYMSFRQQGMWEEMELDTKYKPQYQIEMDAKKDMALEMALELKRHGVAINLIAKASGLSEERIEKLGD